MTRAMRRRERRLTGKTAKAGGVDPHLPALRQALALQQAGRVGEAAKIYRSVLRAKPDHPAALHFLGLALFNTGERDAGLDLVERSLAHDPSNADFHNNWATLLRQTGRAKESIAASREAIRLRPDFAAAHANLAIALKDEGAFADAVASARRAVEAAPRLDLRINLANMLREAGELDEAIAIYRDAVAAKPNEGELHYQLGWMLMEKGRLDEASESLRRVIALQPKRAEAHHALASLKRAREEDDDLQTMRRLYDRADIGETERMTLAFALAKTMEDLGRFDEAFDYIETGNEIARAGFDYSTEAAAEHFETIRKTFDAALFDQFAGSGFQNETPVFILGMPRSGTTLFEQILAGHGEVEAMGELATLQRLADPLLDANDPAASTRRLKREDLEEAGRSYLESVRRGARGEPRRVTDKMPGNFVLLGLIRLILPGATVIHTVRDPASTCLSIYKTYFRSGGHRYGYDLAELGDYYALYSKLMAHWHEVLPGFVHDFRYEDIVADQEGESRRLVAACGLNWDSACIEFQKADRPVRTASVAQVRQPIYRRSVDLWRNYESHLEPLLQRL